jgi:hypothetical protein
MDKDFHVDIWLPEGGFVYLRYNNKLKHNKGYEKIRRYKLETT